MHLQSVIIEDVPEDRRESGRNGVFYVRHGSGNRQREVLHVSMGLRKTVVKTILATLAVYGLAAIVVVGTVNPFGSFWGDRSRSP